MCVYLCHACIRTLLYRLAQAYTQAMHMITPGLDVVFCLSSAGVQVKGHYPTEHAAQLAYDTSGFAIADRLITLALV